jgi:hypothetical protein
MLSEQKVGARLGRSRTSLKKIKLKEGKGTMRNKPMSVFVNL